jgi:hypothetical protein
MSAAVFNVGLMARPKLPVEEKKTETLSTRVTRSLAQALTAIAEADRRTNSFMVEEAVREYVERHGHKVKPKK